MFLKTLITSLHNKEEFDGLKMDLTYVTPQLIAAAMPTEYYLQSFYRLELHSLLKFLDTKHRNHWHIWNLQRDCELAYNPDSLVDEHGKPLVTRIPTTDHKPLTMKDLVTTISSIHDHLESDSKNVAIVHCKCGKGRTGSVIAAYLMLYHGMSSERARAEFTKKRMRLPIVPAVSIPSQVRFLGYLERNQHMLDTSNLSQQKNSFIVTHLIVCNPLFDEYEVVVKPLDEGEPKLANWQITVKGEYHIHKNPSPEDKLLPPDMLVEFIGYKRVAGIRVPLSTVFYPFNVEFEGGADCSPEDLGAETLISQHTKPSSLLSVQSGDSGMVYCSWGSTDGIGGLSLMRGNKAFDNIEVYWSRMQPSFNAPCFSEQVPSLSSLHEKKALDSSLN